MTPLPCPLPALRWRGEGTGAPRLTCLSPSCWPHELTAALDSLSSAKRGRVVLLGIAQRSVTVIWEQKKNGSKRHIPLTENVQTLGDWIRAKRNERNLTPGHLAAKMGFAHTMILSWEDCTSRPSKQQIQDLTRFFQESLPSGIPN